ncbi:MAG TPA: FAD-binding protein, partial [Anaerolineae bacterium]|nr:FAD-binding protein [Anaerolineae bacterium]
MTHTLKSHYDVIVIGAGPGGLAAAIEAKKHGA